MPSITKIEVFASSDVSDATTQANEFLKHLPYPVTDVKLATDPQGITIMVIYQVNR